MWWIGVAVVEMCVCVCVWAPQRASLSLWTAVCCVGPCCNPLPCCNPFFMHAHADDLAPAAWGSLTQIRVVVCALTLSEGAALCWMSAGLWCPAANSTCPNGVFLCGQASPWWLASHPVAC